jgi:glucan-binding YG repeat protein
MSITLELTSLLPAAHEETPAEESADAHAAEEAAPEEPVVAETSAPAVPPKDTAPKNKETNVVDQIKRHSLDSKWFGKKEKASAHEENPSASTRSDYAPVIPEPAAIEPITTDDTPAEEPSNDVTGKWKKEYQSSSQSHVHSV